jgi:hypothetical protein
MSSVLRSLSQTDGLKRYGTEVGATGLIYDINGANGVSVPQNSVLRDMGKMVVLANGILLRKVQVLPLADVTAPYEFKTGYIYLDNVPTGQNIVTIN